MRLYEKWGRDLSGPGASAAGAGLSFYVTNLKREKRVSLPASAEPSIPGICD